jgi:excisionase family DNA binding protein
MLSLGQAARLVRTSKTTLKRAIKDGRLSATRRDDGGYQIDPVELARVYELATVTGDVVHHATTRDTLDVRLVSAEGELTGAELIKFLEVPG